MLSGMFAQLGERAFALPVITMQRFPGSCSAGILRHVYPASAPRVEKDPIATTMVNPATSNLNKQVTSLTLHKYVFTTHGWCVMALWFLAYRVLECGNPFVKLDGVKREQPKEDGRYCWPSKLWYMCDRMDLKTLSSTAQWGEWLLANQEGTGLTVTAVDAPSVHGKGKGYMTFGSPKPDGYGTMRTWIIVISDADRFKEWRDEVTNHVLSHMNITTPQPKQPQQKEQIW